MLCDAVWTLQGGLGEGLAGSFIVPPHRARRRAPMFLIDEPERHLHARAHRPLAAWLPDLVRDHGTQALLTTHAVLFINRADAIAYVARTANSDANVTACTTEELKALGEIAADLGLNRDELLARGTGLEPDPIAYTALASRSARLSPGPGKSLRHAGGGCG
jgi:hypothetical protein